ncbi:MAG TPA: LUD domain-containing protein [Puia sp.]|nr:LUD domain-containing protein [Puia sp.]
MNSRDKILATVKKHQPPLSQLPELPGVSGVRHLPEPRDGATPPGSPGRVGVPGAAPQATEDCTSVFISALEAIGGAVYIVPGFGEIADILRERYPDARRIVSGLPGPAGVAEHPEAIGDPHTLADVDLAVLPAHFGVAENGACWITEQQMLARALPFIAQHLALVFPRSSIVPDMHAAYDRIAALDAAAPYGFSTFIAGPSRTADIEQSLVLGAHGPASLTVFLVDEGLSEAGFF